MCVAWFIGFKCDEISLKVVSSTPSHFNPLKMKSCYTTQKFYRMPPSILILKKRRKRGKKSLTCIILYNPHKHSLVIVKESKYFHLTILVHVPGYVTGNGGNQEQNLVLLSPVFFLIYQSTFKCKKFCSKAFLLRKESTF